MMIMRAARDIIAERGYQAASFQQIAQRAGVSRPTLHYYFATREDLYDKLLSDVRERIQACAATALAEGSLLGQLAAFTVELGRLGEAEPALMKLVMTARIDHHRAVHRHQAAAAIVAAVSGAAEMKLPPIATNTSTRPVAIASIASTTS